MSSAPHACELPVQPYDEAAHAKPPRSEPCQRPDASQRGPALASAAEALQSLDQGLAVFDAADRLVWCNEACAEWLAWGRPEAAVGLLHERMLARRLPDMVLTDDADRGDFWQTWREGRLQRKAEQRVQLKDGRCLRLRSQRTPDGRMLVTVLDVTEAERVAALYRSALAAAEAASAAKDQLLCALSHELRSSLNTILGFAQLLVRDGKQPLLERQRVRAEHIVRGGERIARMVNELLDFARLDAGCVPLDIGPVDVREVLQSVVTRLEVDAQRSRVSLVLDSDKADAVSLAAADRTRLARVLLELGANAIKYNRPNGLVRFEVTRACAGQVRVAVSDNGLGIPEGQQAGLFRAFNRAGRERGPIEGTGLGLIIAKRLVELMGGKIGFRSEPGEGTTFWIELPESGAGARSVDSKLRSKAPVPALSMG